MIRRLVSLLAVAGISGAPTSAAGAEGLHVLCAGDQRADTMAARDHPQISKPNLDRVVERGLALDRACMRGGFQGATCVPSYAMLISGQSLFRIDEKLVRDEIWPEAFGKAGDTPSIPGKWHNGENSLVHSFPKARGLLSGDMPRPLQANLADLADGKLVRHPACS